MSAAAERLIAVHGELAGVLGRDAGGRFVFTYDRACPPDHFVSLTMPVRVHSYVWHELHPVFDGVLPRDATRNALVDRLARAGDAGAFGMLDLCTSHLGRWCLLAGDSSSARQEPVASRELMRAADARPLYADLFGAQFAATPNLAPPPGVRMHAALDAHALFRCDPADGSEAYNEWCALSIARRAGFDTPPFALSADGRVLRLERFDGPPARRLGVEDFCGLQGLGSAARYGGAAERLVSVAAALAPPVMRTGVRRELFRRLMLALLLGDTEFHLQATAVVYSSVDDLRLAPLTGLCTDWSVPPGDARLRPALAIAAQRALPMKKGSLRRFGAHCALSERESGAIIDWLAAALDAEQRALRAAATTLTLPWLQRLEEYWTVGVRAVKDSF